MGGEEATVRVTLISPSPEPGNFDISQLAKDVLEDLLRKMDVTASVKLSVEPGAEEEMGSPAVTLDIEGDDLGILIGRRGQTLAALQYLVRVIVAHQARSPALVTIDVEGYKQRRNESLQNLALRLAAQVKTGQTPFTLEPMPAYERRIIHLALADHPDVTTYSVGEGDSRKVVIEPKKKNLRR